MPSNQIFKSIYFADYKEVNQNSKGLVLAFGDRNRDLYKSIAKLESNELRNLLGTNSYIELEKRAQKEGLAVNTYCLWYLRRNFGVNEAEIKFDKSKQSISNFENRVI